MKQLIEKLNNASDAYYKYDKPIMTDKQYDDLMDRLETLEHETGVIMSNSPLHKVQGKLLDGLTKVEHTKQMLSADKTKDMNVVGRFISKNPTVQSWKLDGLTIVCRYENGKYKQAITRGSGDIGEDVTEAFRHCINLPLHLSKPVNVEVRGECVISWDNFNKINEKLSEPYSHPRNLAAGSVRCLDTNIAKERYLEYKVFELVSIDGGHLDVADSFKELAVLGFDVVESAIVTNNNYLEIDEKFFNPENYGFPVDGTIYKYNSYEYGKSLGSTSHHTLNMLARKWSDELYETTLRDIEWNTTRSGVINPIAIFDEVLLDNAATTRATLHNVSYIEDLKLGIGDTIQVYRANAVIPKVHANLTQSGSYKIIEKCPCCGGDVEIHNENGSKTLHCINPDCQAKLISKLEHACGRQALDIDGMSDATIEFLINKGWVKSIKDLYHLQSVKSEWEKCDGFGKKSVENILAAIEKSRHTTLSRLLYAQSIPLIGRTASKDIEKYCNNSEKTFCDIIENGNQMAFLSIDGFGDVMQKSLKTWAKMHWGDFLELKKEFVFEDNPQSISTSDVNIHGMTFVIAGSLNHFSNRDELKEKLESMGAKVSGSVSAKTTALICNEDAGSSKSQKAASLGVPVWTEDELLKKIGE